MSSLRAKVVEIDNCDSLHIVKFECNGVILSMMSLDLSRNLQVGAEVKLAAKPSHIAIAKDFSGEISYSNQINVTIISIDNGELLSSVKLSFGDSVLESIITLNSSKRMNLQVGESVSAFIKASELSISEILDV
jgi:molybdate transport system regulatory protein